MPISRERAVDLSRRIADRLGKTPGVELAVNAEQLRNRLLQIVLGWDREHERLQAEAKKRLLARPRRPAEGSREWDLLFAEELGRAYQELVGRGE